MTRLSSPPTKRKSHEKEDSRNRRVRRLLRGAGRCRAAPKHGRHPRQPRHGARDVPLLEPAVGVRPAAGARRRARLVPRRLHDLLPPAVVPPGAAGGTVPLGHHRQLRRPVDRGRQADRLPRHVLRIALRLRHPRMGQGRRCERLVLQDEDAEDLRQGPAGSRNRHLGTGLRRPRLPHLRHPSPDVKQHLPVRLSIVPFAVC